MAKKAGNVTHTGSAYDNLLAANQVATIITDATAINHKPQAFLRLNTSFHSYHTLKNPINQCLQNLHSHLASSDRLDEYYIAP